LILNQELGDQLRDVFPSGSFPNLKSIVIEGVSKVVPQFKECYRSRPQAIEDTCRNTEVSYKGGKVARFLMEGKEPGGIEECRLRKLRKSELTRNGQREGASRFRGFGRRFMR
jgi:hypothetical protein